MEEELIDEVDRDGKTIAVHPKSHLKDRMFLHRVSLIIFAAENNQILLCKRQKNKYPFPDTWCCTVGGTSRHGESAENTALREMQEEVGKAYEIKRVNSFVHDKEDYKAIFTVFTTTAPVSPSELKLDSGEIQCCKAFGVDEVLQMISEDQSKFLPVFIAEMKEFAKHYPN